MSETPLCKRCVLSLCKPSYWEKHDCAKQYDAFIKEFAENKAKLLRVKVLEEEIKQLKASNEYLAFSFALLNMPDMNMMKLLKEDCERKVLASQTKCDALQQAVNELDAFKKAANQEINRLKAVELRCTNENEQLRQELQAQSATLVEVNSLNSQLQQQLEATHQQLEEKNMYLAADATVVNEKLNPKTVHSKFNNIIMNTILNLICELQDNKLMADSVQKNAQFYDLLLMKPWALLEEMYPNQIKQTLTDLIRNKDTRVKIAEAMAVVISDKMGIVWQKKKNKELKMLMCEAVGECLDVVCDVAEVRPWMEIYAPASGDLFDANLHDGVNSHSSNIIELCIRPGLKVTSQLTAYEKAAVEFREINP